MFRKLFYILCFNCLVLGAMAQDMEQLVSWNYSAKPLNQVLADISRRYDVQFTYSSDFIPLQYPINSLERNLPLGNALDRLFESTPIVYKRIAGQLVLRVDRVRQKELQEQKQMAAQMAIRRKRTKKQVGQLPKQKKLVKSEGGGDRMISLTRLPEIIAPEVVKEEKTPFVQISLSRYRGWDALEGRKEGKVLIDLLGGSHNNVQGLNIGGGFNNTLHDVEGVQIAGLGNVVNGKMTGVQTAGLFNKVRGDVAGLQVAGIFNLTKSNVKGSQIAGILNIAQEGTKASQIAGVLNYTHGDVRTQLSGFVNIAGNVSQTQTSLFFNKAKKVERYQIGLINVADTVGRASIGLINIIRRGYNRIELSGNEVLFVNLSGKFGTKRFYNILHFGARWDQVNSDNQKGTYMSWGLGYGFGTAIQLNQRTLFNIEAVAIHLNELEAWTKELNLLNQLRFTFDVSLSRRVSLFAGPVLNIYVSKVKSEPSERDIQFEPYTFLDESNINTNVKMWAGINAGIRF